MSRYPHLTREDFRARLDAGQTFRGAGLYEPDHAKAGTEFFFVHLGPKQVEFKRRMT